MQIKTLLLSVLMVTSTGCIGFNYDGVRSYMQQNAKKEFQLGQPMSAVVGGQVVGASLVVDGIYEVVRDFQPPIQNSGKFIYPPLKKGMRFYSTPATEATQWWGTVIPGTLLIVSPEFTVTSRDRHGGYSTSPVQLVISPGGVVQKSIDGNSWISDTLFKKMNPTTRKFALTYTGKENSTITLGYRDYIVEDKEVERVELVRHDLSTGNTFTFKDVTIEVIKATGTQIDYKVISDDDLVGFWGKF